MEEKKLGQVLFFKENEKHDAFKCIGHTGVLPFGDALVAYAEIKNPASQLIEGKNVTELNEAFTEVINNMANPTFCEKYIFPCL